MKFLSCHTYYNTAANPAITNLSITLQILLLKGYVEKVLMIIVKPTCKPLKSNLSFIILQTLLEKSNSKNKWAWNQHTYHRKHKVHICCQTCGLSWVISLPWIAIHNTKAYMGLNCRYETTWCYSTTWLFSLKSLQACFVENATPLLLLVTYKTSSSFSATKTRTPMFCMTGNLEYHPLGHLHSFSTTTLATENWSNNLISYRTFLEMYSYSGPFTSHLSYHTKVPVQIYETHEA